MKASSKSTACAHWALPAMCLLASLPLTASAGPDLAYQKLFGKWALTPTSYYLGGEYNGLAASPKWIVAGAVNAKERGTSEGAVQVFNATTGAFVRKLLPPGPTPTSQEFGSAVAIWGDLALVGARGFGSSTGRAYLYNLASGALLKTLTASDGAAGDGFGLSVALNGQVAVIGAARDDSHRGSIYLFGVATGAELGKIQASDGVAGVDAYFGGSLAMEGNMIAVGAQSANANKGAVYFYDAITQSELFKYQPGSWVAEDYYGHTVAMQMGRVVIAGATKAWRYDLATGAEGILTPSGGLSATEGIGVAVDGPLIAVGDDRANASAGKVHLFDSSDGTFLQTLPPPNSDASFQGFGTGVALSGNTLVASAPYDTTQATDGGCLHLIRPLIRPMEYGRVLGKRDFAPGVPDISYGAIGDVFVNPSGAIAFSSTLTGTSSNRGRDFGAFTDIVVPGTQALLFKSRQSYAGGVVFGKSSMISANGADLVAGLCTLTGAGVNALNNQLFWTKTTAPGVAGLRSGDEIGSTSLAGTRLRAVQELATSNQLAQKQLAAIFTLRSGSTAVTAASDSALYAAKAGLSEEAVREGDATPIGFPIGSVLGQIAPRVAYNYSQQVFSTALAGTGITTANNAAVFKRAMLGTPVAVAQKGDTAVDGSGAAITGASYSAFIGESANGDNGAAYRATLSGTAVTSATNEGVWVLDGTPSRRLALRKGQLLGTPAGVKIARIVSFWSMGNGTVANNQLLALVRLLGTGVNSANDQALVLWQHDGSLNVLMREGDPAPGCAGARIGVISRIDADAWSGSYTVLVTLAGAPSSTNLALYTGDVSRGNATNLSPLRRPFLRVRKGQLFENQPGKVKSVSLPTANVTPGGAGGTGRGRCISYNGDFVFVAEFDNGARQIMEGAVD